MSSRYETHLRRRQEQLMPESILRIAREKGEFRVSLRDSDGWLRRRCTKLKNKGLLRCGGRDGCELVYLSATSADSPAS